MDPEQTLIELRMVSLVPEDVVADLKQHFKEPFQTLSELERMALITASTEGSVSHARLREISTQHSADISKMLANLVKNNFLFSNGVGRGMEYFIPWDTTSTDSIFADAASLTPELGPLTPELGPLTPEPEIEKVKDGLRIISNLKEIPPSELLNLKTIANAVARQSRASPELVKKTVLVLCQGRYLGLKVLAELLGRNPDGIDLRRRILNALVVSGELKRAYSHPNDPRQAYTTQLS